jgi:hypothetical protein
MARLADVFACAPPDCRPRGGLRRGRISCARQPDLLVTPAFQIDVEILVVTHRQSLVQNMTVEGVRELFAGQADPSVQVWVYARGEDVQRVFEQAVMQGRSVTSLARLAVSPQHMSDTLNNEPNTVGILPRRWKAGDRIVTHPTQVLALVDANHRGVQALIAVAKLVLWHWKIMK